MKKSDVFGSSAGKSSSQKLDYLGLRKSTASRRTTVLFTPSSLSAERNPGYASSSKSSSRKTMTQNIMNNKELQHAAVAKIRNYFRRQPYFDSFPMYGQQHLTTKVFIEMVDFLFNILLKTSSITQQNYLEKVPINMKLLGYQGHVQKSWLQVVNTSSAFGHVTAVLAYLVDLVDWQDDSLALDFLFPPPDVEDNDDKTNILKHRFEHELESYEMWSKGDCSMSASDEVDEMDNFTRKIKEELNINDDDIRKVEKDIALLEAELNEKSYVYLLNEVSEAENICKSLQQDEETMSAELKKTREYVRNLEVERNERDKKIQSLEQFYTKKKNEVAMLKQQIANQRITVEDHQNIAKKCNELKDSIKCHEDYYKSVTETIERHEIKIAHLRQEVNNSCLAYNKLLMGPANQLEELAHVRLPPNICQYDPEAINIGHELRTMYSKALVKKTELEAELKNAESKTSEGDAKLETIFSSIKEKEVEKMQLKDQLKVEQEELDKLREDSISKQSEVIAEICKLDEVLSSCKEREQELLKLKKLKEEKDVLIKDAKIKRQEILDDFTLKAQIIQNVYIEKCLEALERITQEEEDIDG